MVTVGGSWLEKTGGACWAEAEPQQTNKSIAINIFKVGKYKIIVLAFFGG